MNNTPKIVGTVVISAVLLIGAYVVLSGNSESDESAAVTVTNQSATASESTTQTQQAETNDTQAEESTATTQQPAEEAQAPASSNTYNDGTYEAAITYRVPEGHTEDLTVNLTLSNDTISSITVDTVATNGESAEYQSRFDPLIVGEVEGQDLDDADVNRLGGASLTSGGFNDALDEIRNAARS